MTCPPGTGCARRADCQDGYCPGRQAARTAPATATAAPIARPIDGSTADWLHIRPGGARIDGPAGTAVHTSAAGQFIPFGHSHSAADTEGAFWLPERDPPSPFQRLDDAIEDMFSSPFAWLVLSIVCIVCAVGVGLLAGHIAEHGPDRVWALLIGGAK